MSSTDNLRRELTRLRAEHSKAKTDKRKATLAGRIERVTLRLAREERREQPTTRPAASKSDGARG